LDIEDLGELIQLHGKAVYGFCRRLAGNKPDADDLYQETFLKAMEVRHKIDMNHNPKGFLISLAIGLRKNNRRKFAWRRRIAPITLHDEAVNAVGLCEEEATPEAAILSLELRRAVQAAADSLSNKLKIPLLMYYTAEMSVDEIASALNIPSGTVKSRLHQARSAMKKILEVEIP